MAIFDVGEYPAGRAFRDDASGNWVLVPEKVTADTPVHIYYTGAGGKGNTPLIIKNTYFNDPNFDGIIIVCSNGDGYWASESAVENQIETNRRIIAEIEEENGVTLNTRNVYGSSIGDKFAIKDFARQCTEGTDDGVLCLTGPSTAQASSTEGYNTKASDDPRNYDPNRAFLSEEEYESIKGKTVVLFERGDKASSDYYAPENYTYIKALNEHGANVYLVKCKGSGHDQLSSYPLQDGLFSAMNGGTNDEIINFISDNENFLDIERCIDVDSNTWQTVSANDLYTSPVLNRNALLCAFDRTSYQNNKKTQSGTNTAKCRIRT